MRGGDVVSLRNYRELFLRAFFFAACVGIMTIVGEILFVLVMRLAGYAAHFTAFYALVLFAAFLGLSAAQPSPSRISRTRIDLAGRALLILEFTILVALAIFASSKYMSYERVVVPVDIDFAAYAYVLVLVVMLIANFGRLRLEGSSAG